MYSFSALYLASASSTSKNRPMMSMRRASRASINASLWAFTSWLAASTCPSSRPKSNRVLRRTTRPTLFAVRSSSEPMTGLPWRSSPSRTREKSLRLSAICRSASASSRLAWAICIMGCGASAAASASSRVSGLSAATADNEPISSTADSLRIMASLPVPS